MPKKDYDKRALVIKSLRTGSCKFSDLKNSLKITDQALDRILKELVKMNIVEKNSEGYWVLVGQTYESDYEKQRSLEHSDKLLPGFESILNHFLTDYQLTFDERAVNNAALQHLETGYPKTYAALMKSRKILQDNELASWRKVQKAFEKAEFLEGSKVPQFWVGEKVPHKPSGFMEKLLKVNTDMGLRKIEIPYAFRFKNLDAAAQALKDAEINNIDLPPPKLYTEGEFVVVMGPLSVKVNQEKLNEALETYAQAAGIINQLIAQVKLGRKPINGNCSLCSINLA